MSFDDEVTVLQNYEDISMSAADAARWKKTSRHSKIKKIEREWYGKKLQWLREISLAEHNFNNETSESADAALKAIEQFCRSEDSYNRLSTLLQVIRNARSELFWPALMRNWPACDDIWTPTRRLVEAMRMHNRIPRREFYSDEQRAFFDSLPNTVEVFRGCSRYRVRGVSWTTERAFAESFPHWRLPDWVVAAAVIPKDEIFFVNTDWKENEVV